MGLKSVLLVHFLPIRAFDPSYWSIFCHEFLRLAEKRAVGRRRAVGLGRPRPRGPLSDTKRTAAPGSVVHSSVAHACRAASDADCARCRSFRPARGQKLRPRAPAWTGIAATGGKQPRAAPAGARCRSFRPARGRKLRPRAPAWTEIAATGGKRVPGRLHRGQRPTVIRGRQPNLGHGAGGGVRSDERVSCVTPVLIPLLCAS